MATKGTKIYINENREGGGAESVMIKDGQEEKKKKFEEERQVLDRGVEKFYQDSGIFERPKQRNFSLWLFVILAILFGLIAGSLGSLFILTREKIELPFLKQIDLAKYLPTREVTLITEKKVTVTEEQRITEMVKAVQLGVVKVYLARQKSPTKNSSIFESAYKDSEITGQAVVLTNDGWLLTTAGSIPDPAKDYFVVSSENKIFSVKKIVYDSLTDFVFLKTELSGLPVAKIADFSSLSLGQKIFLFDKDGSLIQTTLANLLVKPTQAGGAPSVYSTERLPFYFISQEKLNDSFLGAAVFTLDKSVIGLVNSSNKITPIFYLRNVLPQVLEKEEVARPKLGLEYLDLSEMIGLQDTRYQGFNYGAIVYGSPESKTPAAKAGLKNGDLIIKVDGLPFNGRANLTEIVQSKKPGEKIEFGIVRDGKELILTATLSSF
jgi:serine protease Do